METTRKYVGIDIINKLTEFISLTPNPDDWFLDKLKSNPPRSILLQQIFALMNAFEIEQNQLQMFIAGDFPKESKLEDYPKLYCFVKEYMKDSNELLFTKLQHYMISEMFSQLFAYKRQLQELLNFNSGYIHASGLIRFAIQLTNATSHSINTNDLDNVLESIINPRALSFTEEELITKYQFPSEEEYLKACMDWL
jgi:hypothetical protein